MDGMQSRINAVAQTTRVVSAPSNATVQAITAGMEVTKQAAHDSIVQRFTNSALSRFGMHYCSLLTIILHPALCIFLLPEFISYFVVIHTNSLLTQIMITARSED